MISQVRSFIFERTTFTDIYPDSRSSSGERLIDTVNPRESIEEYIGYSYKYATSGEEILQRDILKTQAIAYGQDMHCIRGNGDCGTTSFATGLLYHILNSTEAKAQEIIETTNKLMTDETLVLNTQLNRDIQETIGLLSSFKNALRTDNYLNEALLKNNSFMLAFSRVIRAIGNKNIPNVMHDELLENQMDPLEYAEMLIPSTPTKDISIEAYKPLSLIFGLQVHVIELTGGAGTPVQQYPEELEYTADIVIVRSPGHFFSVIPNTETQDLYGKTQSPPIIRHNIHQIAVQHIPPIEQTIIPSSLVNRVIIIEQKNKQSFIRKIIFLFLDSMTWLKYFFKNF